MPTVTPSKTTCGPHCQLEPDHDGPHGPCAGCEPFPQTAPIEPIYEDELVDRYGHLR